MHSAAPFLKASVAGTEVDVFPLETISFAALEAKDTKEAQKLLHAAEDPGFFYLSLQDTELRSVFTDEESLYKLCEAFFDQPHDTKLESHRTDHDRGYQFCATDETFEIARDEITRHPAPAAILPPPLDAARPLLTRFSSACDAIAQSLLQHLSRQLGGDGLIPRHLHDPALPSDTGLKLVSEPTTASAAAVDNAHTDGGTLTLLFGADWGVQLLLQQQADEEADADADADAEAAGRWAFVEPGRGVVLVNVADALQSVSGGRLRSGVHRVAQPVDGAGRRYFVTYFLRPAKGVAAEGGRG